MKFLCICQYGHSRSVACCRVMHALKHEAIAVGHGTSPSAMAPASDWADVIIVMEGYFAAFVPAKNKHKVVVFEVGADRWSNPYNEELQEIIRKMADARGY